MQEVLVRKPDMVGSITINGEKEISKRCSRCYYISQFESLKDEWGLCEV